MHRAARASDFVHVVPLSTYMFDPSVTMQYVALAQESTDCFPGSSLLPVHVLPFKV
jgi:hypothetical protein